MAPSSAAERLASLRTSSEGLGITTASNFRMASLVYSFSQVAWTKAPCKRVAVSIRSSPSRSVEDASIASIRQDLIGWIATVLPASFDTCEMSPAALQTDARFADNNDRHAKKIAALVDKHDKD